MGYAIINEIIWVQRNGRPNVATRRLQASHQNILWIAKDSQRYRFNYRLCKRSAYDDWLSKPNQQMRDVWDIPANGRENTSHHPSPKPLAVLKRILDVAGKPGGLLLDLFSGSGTGAVAASTWGMRSISVESEDGIRADDPGACRRRSAKTLTMRDVSVGTWKGRRIAPHPIGRIAGKPASAAASRVTRKARRNEQP